MKIAAWNVARGLSSPENHRQINDGIEQLDADILVLSEAFDHSRTIQNPEFARQLGYNAQTTAYEDSESHPSGEQFIVMLSRITLSHSEVRLGTRSAIKLSVPSSDKGNDLQIYGAHFDDRSERNRLKMAKAFINDVNQDEPAVLAGDLNSIHANDRIAKILRSKTLSRVASLAPHPRVRSLATRLTEMADGSTLAAIEQAGFTDVDPDHEPTMSKAGLRVALDHFLIRGQVESSNFLNQALAGSDHHAISVDLKF